MSIRKRKRGVKSSRKKLEQAMLKRGFQTQSALAHQIASNENLDKPPKDLVSKVFREQAVSTYNLSRIAKALEVEPHTIYLSKDDLPISAVLDDQSEYKNTTAKDAVAKKPKHKSKTLWTASLGTFVFIVAVFIVFKHQEFKGLNKSGQTNTAIESPLGKVLLVVQAPSELNALAKNIINSVNKLEDISVIMPESPNAFEMPSNEALRKWQAHGIVRVTFTEGEYYKQIGIEIHSKQHYAKLAQWFLYEGELTLNSPQIARHTTKQILNFVNGENLSPVYSNSENALEQYLQGLNALFLAHSADDIEKAESHFLLALEADENFMQAIAYMCTIKVRESWIKEERSSLEMASQYCQQAQDLANDEESTFTNALTIAQLELLSRTGKIQEALVYARQQKLNPLVKIDVLAALAEMYLVAQGNNAEQDYTDKILPLANEAINIEPRHWRASNTLGNYYFSTGNIAAAKNHFEAAAKIVQQVVILANVGTMQLCFDELESAKFTYQTIIENSDNNYIGHEQLGTVLLMQGDFIKGLEHKLISIEQQPDIAIHQVWSGLAEAYLLNGDKQSAYEKYTSALRLLERDELLENATLSDQLYKLYYKGKLNHIFPDLYSLNNLSSEVEVFINKRANLRLKARSHLAWLTGQTNNHEAKTQIIKEITKICPVYHRVPELT